MSFAVFKNLVIDIPIIQIIILIGICTLFALLGRLKLVLVTLYGFVTYWVFFLNQSKFGSSDGANIFHTGLLIVTAGIFIGISVWILFVER